MVAWRRLLMTALVLAFAACGGDTDDASPVTGTDAVGESDGATGVCEHPCLNEFDKNDKKLCPDPKSEWNCTGGCCVPVFRCATDDDCATQGFAEGQCTDERFGCRCEVDTGVCFPWHCAVDSECTAGEVCDGGSCVAAPSSEDLSVRIIGGPRVLVPNATGQLLADTWNPDTEVISPDIGLQWASDDASVVSVSADGSVTGGDTAGETTIRAQLVDSPGIEATWAVRNVTPDAAATVTLICVISGTLDPVQGTYAMVDTETGTVLDSGTIPADGVLEATAEGASGVDVHIFGDGTDWVSWLHGEGVVLLPVPRTAWGEISLDPDGNVLADGTELEGMNIVRGEVDFGVYPKMGEFEITLSSFPLGNGLFDFSLQTLLGPDVSRYFDPDHSIPGVDTAEEAEIPGGVTFSLSTPAIRDYQLGAQPGDRHIWTLGGRVSLDEISEYADVLFGAFDGDGLDFNLLVGTLFPTFAEFWSAVTPIPPVAGDGSLQSVEVPVTLEVPLPLRTLVTVPTLPAMERNEAIPGVCPTVCEPEDPERNPDEESCVEVGGGPCVTNDDCAEGGQCEGSKPEGFLGWADALFMLNGAITGDGLFVPLGINAGSDTSDPEGNPADGVADSDEDTAEQDPYSVPGASLHSGLGSPHTRYGLAIVAASIPANGDDPRPDAGSALLHRYDSGQAPAETLAPSDFLGLSLSSTWEAASRTLTVDPIDGADTQRVLFKGRRGHHWTVWLRGQQTYTVPVKAELLSEEEEEAEDRTNDPQLLLVNSFDFAAGIDLDQLVAPGGSSLDELLHVVERASFVDIRP